MRMDLAVLAICLAGTGAAQLVQTDPNDSRYCANVEHIKANLHPSSVQLSGHVEDETGAPFKNTRIELRRYISEARQVGVANANTNDRGDFDLGHVSKGEYRLLASSTRAFQQPDESWCNSGRHCFLRITLKANPTDLPASQCPIRRCTIGDKSPYHSLRRSQPDFEFARSLRRNGRFCGYDGRRYESAPDSLSSSISRVGQIIAP